MKIGSKKYNKILVSSLMGMFLGDEIGRGTTRRVFSFEDSLVLKLELNDELPLSNLMENNIWEEHYHDEEKSKWFAECHSLSPCGRILIQEQLTPFESLDDPRLPDKIPKLFADRKIQNWGVDSEGNPKCLDYGCVNLQPDRPWTLTKSHWWDENEL